MVQIKICGLTRPSDIETVNKILPDYIGFVFAKSRRQVDETTASKLKKMLDPRIKAAGVFVNESPELIIKLCKANVIDIVQLHGDEDNAYIQSLKQNIDNPVIKAIRVRNDEDLQHASNYHCDYLLLDTFKENQYGGSGETFDWTLISGLKKPFFLAGGIHKDNVEEALSQSNPYCIDVSSGVETDGFKDPLKIEEIVMIIRSVR